MMTESDTLCMRSGDKVSLLSSMLFGRCHRRCALDHEMNDVEVVDDGSFSESIDA